MPPQAVLRVHAYDLARRLHQQVAARAGTPGAVHAAVEALVGHRRLVFVDELPTNPMGKVLRREVAFRLRES